MDTFSAVKTDGMIVVPTQNEANSLYQDGYGRLVPDSRLLSLEPFEALYLTERQKISVISEEDHERLVFQEILSRYSKDDPDLWTRYMVYRDLRTRGFVAKRGPGYGVDFLVYERGASRRKEPRHLVYVVGEGSPEPVKHLTEILGASNEENWQLKLAVVDRRGEIVYYNLSNADVLEEGFG